MNEKKLKPTTMEDRVLSLEYGAEKTERHYGELKDKIEGFSSDISDIKNAVVGHAMNGNSGMVHDLKKHKAEIYELQVQCIKYDLYFRQLSVVVCALLVGLITALIKIFV